MLLRLAIAVWFLFTTQATAARTLLALPSLGERAVPSLTDLPSCALSCLLTAVTDPESPCLVTNQTCICANAQLQSNVSSCVLQSCTVRDSLLAINASSTACEAPVRNRQRELTVTSIVLLSLSVSAVLARLLFKLFWAEGSRAVNVDDILIVLAICVGIPSTILSILRLTGHGMGRDIWTLSPDDITQFGFWLYVLQILYAAGLTLIKLSLLFFYMRIFSAANIQMVIWAAMGLNAAFGLTFVFTAIFACSPIEYFWLSWDGEHEGTCVSINGVAWAQGGLSILLDIGMLAIPFSQLRTLKLHWKKKVGVGFMFCIGTFITIVSILRLRSLVTYSNSINPTWDDTPASMWSGIELNVGIICTCLPTLRMLLVRLFPILKGTTIRSRPAHIMSDKNSPSHGDTSSPATNSDSINRNSFMKAYKSVVMHKYATSTDTTGPFPLSQPKEASETTITGRGASRRTSNPWNFNTTEFGDESIAESGGVIQQKSFAVSYGDTDSIELPKMGETVTESRQGTTVQGGRSRPRNDTLDTLDERPLQTRFPYSE